MLDITHGSSVTDQRKRGEKKPKKFAVEQIKLTYKFIRKQIDKYIIIVTLVLVNNNQIFEHEYFGIQNIFDRTVM